MRREEEKQKLYRQVILDFANAENKEEACFKLIENIQHAFDFPLHFRARAEKIEPCYKIYEKYRDENYSDEDMWFKYDADVIELSLKSVLEALSKRKALHECPPPRLPSVHLPDLDPTLTMGGPVPTRLLLNYYNNQCSSRCGYNLDSDGSIVPTKPFTEGDFLGKLPEGNMDNFFWALVYCAVEFLKSPKNRQSIRKCPFCEKFFFARDIKRRKCCYSKECEKVYQKYKKRQQRENDPLRYYTK